MLYLASISLGDRINQVLINSSGGHLKARLLPATSHPVAQHDIKKSTALHAHVGLLASREGDRQRADTMQRHASEG